MTPQHEITLKFNESMKIPPSLMSKSHEFFNITVINPNEMNYAPRGSGILERLSYSKKLDFSWKIKE